MNILVPLGFLFLLLLNALTVMVVLVHVHYIQRIAKRLNHLEGQTGEVIEALQRQSSILITLVENQ